MPAFSFSETSPLVSWGPSTYAKISVSSSAFGAPSGCTVYFSEYTIFYDQTGGKIGSAVASQMLSDSFSHDYECYDNYHNYKNIKNSKTTTTDHLSSQVPYQGLGYQPGTVTAISNSDPNHSISEIYNLHSIIVEMFVCPVGLFFNSDYSGCIDTPPSCSDYEGQFVDLQRSGEYVFSSRECFDISSDLSCYIDRDGPNTSYTVTKKNGGQFSYGGIYSVSSDSCQQNNSDFRDEGPSDAPSGCIVGESGVQLCIDENGGSEMSATNDDGQSVSAPDGSICLEISGSFTCIQTTQDDPGCGYVNGVYNCYGSDGLPIDPSSPDHPINGGNGDGNVNNDVLDPSNPNDSVSDSEQSRIDANEIGNSISESLTEKIPLSDSTVEYVGTVDSNISDIENLSDKSNIQFDSIEQSLSVDSASNLFDQKNSIEILGSKIRDKLGIKFNSCSDFDIHFPDFEYQLSCSKFENFREILKWFFYVLFLFYVFFRVVITVRQISD
jgi:hypothetical protein